MGKRAEPFQVRRAELPAHGHLQVITQQGRSESLGSTWLHCRRAGMSSLAVETDSILPRSVPLTDDDPIVELTDGCTLSVPLAWYPRRQHGTPEERGNSASLGAARAATGRISTKTSAFQVSWPDARRGRINAHWGSG